MARPVRRPTVQHRLLVALVGVSVGAVLLAGVLTAVFARKTSRDAALGDLERRATALEQAPASAVCGTDRGLRAALRLDEGGIVIVRNGRIIGGNAPRLQIARGVLDATVLANGQRQVVRRARFVLVAQPLAPCPRGRPVAVLVAQPSFLGIGRLGPYFVMTAAITALIAIAVSVALARRLGAPIGSMQRAARTIADGDLTARVVITDDTPDELATLASTLNDMAVRLEHSRGLERAFLMSISHDLRTPLTSIRGYAEAIREGAVDDDEARQRAAAVIAQEGRRLERLVADLLDLARLDAREFSFRLEPVDIVPIVRSAAEAFAPAAAEAGVALHLDLAPAAVASVDADRLGQVVANLVENALKYATDQIEVSVSPTAPPARPGGVTLAVVDNGPGIAPADLDHVFDRLYTSRRGASRAVGTGLGLAIVRELCAAMGATVRADSAPTGSRMVVVFPGSNRAGPDAGR